MKVCRHILILCALVLAVPARTAADRPAGLCKSLRAVAGRDTVVNVWVFFKDRPPSDAGGAAKVSDRAVLRRRRAGFAGSEGDRPVNRRYIGEVERRGGRLRHEFGWENAASFSAAADRLAEIAGLPFVESVSPVAVYVRRDAVGRGPAKSSAARAEGGYEWHTEMTGVPMAHEYLRTKGLGDPGSGIRIAFFDTGFRLDHSALSHVRTAGLVLSEYDFVAGGGSVRDPAGNYDKHGTQCMALVAGYDPGAYIGAAWGSQYLLARTEDSYIESRIEEDNWAAAVEWAEARGADIISSSLGYREDFDDPSQDYAYRDMDGKTTIVSKAAAGAVARGVIVVTSMGNEGSDGFGTLTAPADVDGAVSVGAVRRDRSLASFSSVGPTYDNRIKPEVSAPGENVQIISHPQESGYTTGNGTSFSAPIVSGIMALILQAHPGISADSARKRLYASCDFAPEQTSFDNNYGHGIPNARRAVMNGSEIFIKLTDTAGAALRGAQVTVGGNTYAANEFGGVIINTDEYRLPLDVRISYRGETLQTLTVSADELPLAKAIAFEVQDSGLRIFHNTVNRNGVIRGRYYFPSANTSKPASIAIHTISGRKVWSGKLKAQPDGSAVFEWNGKTNTGGKIASGVYLLTVRHGGNMVGGRFTVP